MVTPPLIRRGRPIVRLSFNSGLLAALLSLIVFFRHTPEFTTLSITFVSIFLEALPFMLLGALVGGFIEVFVSKTVVTRIVPSRPLPAILLAAGLGLVFPVCECAIVPVVRRLFKKGLPLGAGIAFLLGGPIVNPLVAISTAVAYGNDLSIAGYRLASGYLIAVAMGLLIDRLFSRRTALLASAEENTPQKRVTVDGAELLIVRVINMLQALRHGASDFIDVGRFLVVGAFVAGGAPGTGGPGRSGRPGRIAAPFRSGHDDPGAGTEPVQ
jgi:uncharacterized membrane protein YraQ (UPF0718 family)